MPASRHPTLTQSFSHRASLPNTHPLAAYLLNLITIKQSNLCVSADVCSTAALIQLAEDVGDSICVLKTHADIVDDWSERTVRRLKEISRQKGFLLFEDRKFGDIGSQTHPTSPPTPCDLPPNTRERKLTNIPKPGTVQKQYTAGHHRIATWAPLVNAHIFPGPSIITALQEAAAATLVALNQCVSTEISAGTPRTSSDGDDVDDTDEHEDRADKYSCTGRKRSIVTATTISQYTERTVLQTPLIIPRSVPDDHDADDDGDDGDEEGSDDDEGGEGRTRAGKQRQMSVELSEAPVARGLLLLAEMSSEGNLLTGPYTRRCVELARQHRDFVLGFVAQRCLNTEPGDNFISFTPGVSLPPPSGNGDGEGESVGGVGKGVVGDGLGQQYRTPRLVVLEEGCDVVIVGRGILKARDRKREAERYRVEAWRAYEERVRGGRRK